MWRKKEKIGLILYKKAEQGSSASNMSAEPIGLASNKGYYNTSGTWSSSYKYYWMADWGSSTPSAFGVVFNTGQLLSYNADECNGYAIRPFKDDPVVPDSSWTKIWPLS